MWGMHPAHARCWAQWTDGGGGCCSFCGCCGGGDDGRWRRLRIFFDHDRRISSTAGAWAPAAVKTYLLLPQHRRQRRWRQQQQWVVVGPLQRLLRGGVGCCSRSKPGAGGASLPNRLQRRPAPLPACWLLLRLPNLHLEYLGHLAVLLPLRRVDLSSGEPPSNQRRHRRKSKTRQPRLIAGQA